MNVDPTTWSLASVSGIVAITFVIVEILKRLFSKNAGFGKIPVFVWVIAITLILVFISNRFIVVNGKPILDGNVWQLLWAGFLAAAVPSGFYTWLSNPESVAKARPLGQSA